MDIQQGIDTVLVVAGSGDQFFDIAVFSPKKIKVVDRSKAQINLAKLKGALIKYLDRNEYFELIGFFGIDNSKEGQLRKEIFFRKAYLQADSEEKVLLIKFKNLINKGLSDSGKANWGRKIVNVLRKLLPDKYFKTLTGFKGEPEARTKMKLAKLVFAILKKMSFLAPKMISPKIIEESSKKELKEIYQATMEKNYSVFCYGLARIPILVGVIGENINEIEESTLPLHLREGNYKKLQTTLREISISYVHGDLKEKSTWKECNVDGVKPNKLYLSSVPTYLSLEERRKFFKMIRKFVDKGSLMFTCSHDLKNKIPDEERSFYKEVPFERSGHVSTPAQYNQEKLYII